MIGFGQIMCANEIQKLQSPNITTLRPAPLQFLQQPEILSKEMLNSFRSLGC